MKQTLPISAIALAALIAGTTPASAASPAPAFSITGTTSLAGRALVTAYALPSGTLRSARPGTAKFRLTKISQTAADFDGSFSAPLAATFDYSPFMDRFGDFDVEIIATNGSENSMTTFSLSRTKSPRPAFKASGAQLAGVGVEVKLGRVGRVPGLARTHVFSKGRLQASGGSTICSYDRYNTTSPIDIEVGSVQNHNSGIAGDLTFTSGANSTTDVGVSGSGKYGTYSAQGTTTKTAGFTAEFPAKTTRSGQKELVHGIMGRYTVTCYLDGYPYETHEEVRNDGYTGGYGIAPLVPGNATYCGQVPRRGRFTRSVSKAHTWSTGFDVHAFIGVNLKSTAGYTGQVSQTYYSIYPTLVCGEKNYPGSDTRSDIGYITDAVTSFS